MAQFPGEALAKQGKLVEMVDCLNLFEDYQHQNHSKLKGVISDKSEAQAQKDCYEKMANNSLKEGKVREALTQDLRSTAIYSVFLIIILDIYSTVSAFA